MKFTKEEVQRVLEELKQRTITQGYYLCWICKDLQIKDYQRKIRLLGEWAWSQEYFYLAYPSQTNSFVFTSTFAYESWKALHTSRVPAFECRMMLLELYMETLP